ncbi:MAG: carboxypeptidase regulatory-like domain-containing protein, partial [Flavobacteriales bacterium]|nr:carboxypeptidase regulatory-like domain-containing protein [Flavobacteriales bacterium]
MKTLKTLLLLLATTASAFAQLSPDDLLITGSVVDSTGGAMGNTEVCVTVAPNNITFPLDTLCTTTDSNGNYSIPIIGGSASGPNVSFIVFMTDPCSNPINPTILSETVDNAQGTVDTATVNFVACANSNACGLEAEIIATVDSSGGGIVTILAALVTGGTPPYSYSWTPNVNEMSQTIVVTEPGDYCAIVTDANGCVFTVCETVGDPNGGCVGSITVTSNPNQGNTLLTVNSTGVAPFTYLWNTGDTTQSIDVTGFPSTYCVTITDANGCETAEVCEAVGCIGVTPQLEITTTMDSSGGGLVYTLDAGTGYTSYLWWPNGEDVPTITVQNVSPSGEVFCVFVTDNNDCSASTCDTLFPINNNPCQAGFSYPGDSNGVLFVGDTVQLFFDGVASNQSAYLWTLSTVGFQFTATGENPIFVLPPSLIPVNGIPVEICVTVIDSLNNCSDQFCETVLAVPDNNNPNCEGYISGQVYAGSNNQPLFSGVVYLITFEPNSNQLT